MRRLDSDSPQLDQLAARLRASAGNLTVQQIATITSTNRETVRRYLRGDTPSVEFIIRFCRAFAVSADWLLLGRDPDQVEPLPSPRCQSDNAPRAYEPPVNIESEPDD